MTRPIHAQNIEILYDRDYIRHPLINDYVRECLNLLIIKNFETQLHGSVVSALPNASFQYDGTKTYALFKTVIDAICDYSKQISSIEDLIIDLEEIPSHEKIPYFAEHFKIKNINYICGGNFKFRELEFEIIDSSTQKEGYLSIRIYPNEHDSNQIELTYKSTIGKTETKLFNLKPDPAKGMYEKPANCIVSVQ